MRDFRDINRFVILFAILCIFVLAFLVLQDILIPIIFAFLFAFIFSPLYKKIYSKLKRPNLSAFILIIILGLVVAVPLIYFTPILIRQMFEIYVNFQSVDLGSLISTRFGGLLNEEVVTQVGYKINSALGQTVSVFMNQFLDVLIDLPNLLLKMAVFFFTFYFAVRDSDKLGRYVSRLSPFSVSTERKFKSEFRGITNSIMLGQVLIGIIQGLALGVGLWLLGVPNVLTLTVLTSLVSIIPVLGSWLVWLPTSIVLMVGGQLTSGLILLFYGALFVASIDNFIRPYLLSKSSDLPLAVSLVGTIGGLYFLGILGLIIGPLILAYALIVLDFYQKGKLNELTKERERDETEGS